MDYFYTTIENQKRNDGTFGLLFDHYEGEVNGVSAEQRAWAKFYTVAAAAVVSDIPYHSVALLRSDGAILDQRVFDRREEEQTNE